MKTTIKNANTKLNSLLRVMGLSVILLGMLGSLVSCGGAETTTPLEGIQGEATFGDQTTTDVSTFSVIDDDGTTYYYIIVVGLTNELDSSGADGSLMITEYSGGNVVKDEAFSFLDPIGIGDVFDDVGFYVSRNNGVTYEVYIDFEGSIRGTATFGNQTTTEVYSGSYEDEDSNQNPITVYYVNVLGLTNETDSLSVQGSLTITEYSGGNVTNEKIFSFSDPMGIVETSEYVGDYVSSIDGGSYTVTVDFEGNIGGTATFGSQTTTSVYSDRYETVDISGVTNTSYIVEVYGLINEPDSSNVQGSLTIYEYSSGNIVKQETLTFTDPVGEDSETWESLAGFTDSSGDSYDVSIRFRARQ